MKERNPALTYVLAMEDHIRTVARIGTLLLLIGERNGEITATTLNCISKMP